MVGRSLQVVVWGEKDPSERVAELLEVAVSSVLIDDGAVPLPLFSVEESVSDQLATRHHFVVSAGSSISPWADVVITSDTDAEVLGVNRLAPWAVKWHNGRRAPRAQVAVLVGPDQTWPETAARLISRLRTHTMGTPTLRIDHIGSTSVPGLTAKNLIDIQVMVPTLSDVSEVAEAATGAGFVRVPGALFGLDRLGNQHPEQVVVDADPGRPVNVNIRSADAPVARETLLYRDWLKANVEGRKRYAAMKAGLVGRHIDDYSGEKEPFIGDALGEAETWAMTTGWQP